MSHLHPDKEAATLENTEFAELVKTLPEEHRQSFQELFDRTRKEGEHHRRVLRFIQESLSQIRLDMKYLMFDLEATRRERDDYKQKLENMEQ